MNQGSDFNQLPGDDGMNKYDDMMLFVRICIIVILILILLHVYGRFLCVQSARYIRRSCQRSAFMRHQFYFTGEEPATLRNVGLDSAILETLPMFVYRLQIFTDELECAVCLFEFQEKEHGRILPNCEHSFHVDCIDMWFLSHSTCPLCKTAAQPEQPVFESGRIGQVSATIPTPIASGIHSNLNLEQGQTASSKDEYDLQYSPPNVGNFRIPFGRNTKLEHTHMVRSAICDRIASHHRNRQKTQHISEGDKEQMNADMDEGTSGGRALMPDIAVDVPKKADVFWSPGEGHMPNDSQSSSKSPVSDLRLLTNKFTSDNERKISPSDHPGERDLEHDGAAQRQ